VSTNLTSPAATRSIAVAHPWTRSLSLRLAVPSAIGAISAIAVGVPALVGWSTGSLRLPHNDDWAYSRVALGFARTGHIHLVGWNQMTLVGHILLAWPFLKILGPSQTHLNLAGAAVSTFGIVCSYLLTRRLASRGAALLVAATVAAMPGFSALSVTFMTDPSSFATQAATLALGVAALTSERRRVELYFAALAMGFVSFAIRETAVAASVAVTIGVLLAHRREPRALRLPLAGFGVAAAATAAFYIWRQTLAGGQPMPLHAVVSGTTAGLVLRILFLLGFALLPVSLTLAHSRRSSRVSGLPLAAAALTVAAFGVAAIRLDNTPWGLFPGNYLTRLGATPQGVAIDEPTLFPPALWWLLIALGLLGSALAAGLATAAVRRRAWRRLGSAEAMLAVFALLNLAILLFRSASQGHLYDRYAWPLVLALAALAAGRTTSPRRPGLFQHGAAWTAAVAISVSGLAVAVNDSAASAGRWAAGAAAAALGYQADTIDAGFEWVGAHAPDPGPAPHGLRATYPVHWYMIGAFPYLPNCVVVSYPAIRNGGLIAIGSTRYASLLPPGEQTLHLYLNRVACPGAPLRRPTANAARAATPPSSRIAVLTPGA
jgi:4-amino-4-deoxy-L-arabinose transferase-like glycosyltransferase